MIDEYYRVVETEGEIAGLEFLAAEVGGYHVTPYDVCTQSFLTSGCLLHLECFNGCCNLTKTDDPEAEDAIRTMEGQLVVALRHIEKTSPDTAGRKNQLEQIKRKLTNVRRLLKAEPGQKAFSGGTDLSAGFSAKRTPLDDDDL